MRFLAMGRSPSMFARLVILFITIPLIEIYLLFRLYDITKSALASQNADSDGSGAALVTVGIVLFTGFLGAWLARQQGLSTVQKIQKALAQGKMPGAELVDGGMILFAAALLLTPGMLTDAFGFSLLMPWCRKFYRAWLKKYFPSNVVQFRQSGPGPFGKRSIRQ